VFRAIGSYIKDKDEKTYRQIQLEHFYEYLKAGDKVAMISPSYFTPMETIEKAADVLRSWGFEPVIGPNVGKVLDGKIGVSTSPSSEMSPAFLCINE